MNEKQFNKNKKWISWMLADWYPGVKVAWSGTDPSIEIPDDLVEKQNEIISAVQKLISYCGGEAVFYPEQAFATDEKDNTTWVDGLIGDRSWSLRARLFATALVVLLTLALLAAVIRVEGWAV